MKQKNKRSLSVFWRLTLMITAVWFVLLSLTMGLTMHYAVRSMKEKIDNVLMSTVKMLGNSPSIRQILEQGYCDGEMIDYLTDVIHYTADMDSITIADINSVRLYCVIPAGIGQRFEGGDQYRALEGETYLSDAMPGDFETQRRAFHPIRDGSGEVIGFVMASASPERINALRDEIIVSYLGLGTIMMVCTLILCTLLALYLRRNLRGLKPDDLIRSYLVQNDMLNALNDGLVSFDNAGRVRLVNASAARMLGHREDMLIGRNVDELLRAEDGSSLRDWKDETMGFQSSRPNILVRPVQLPDSNLWARQVLILADKSEIARYAEELGGTRHLVSTLRARTHEFLNKLQVISGLLQMGRTEDAQKYIGQISAVHEQINTPVMKLIHNTSVAALILGKASYMRELDISLVLMRNSALPEQSAYLSTAELVTVVGNLMENAIEATNVIPAEDMRAVTVQITEDEKGLFIMVSDTGEGISEKDLPRIFDKGFSTKANTGRGVGMRRIREIVEGHGGTIDVDTEPGSGTTFTIIISQKRGGSL